MASRSTSPPVKTEVIAGSEAVGRTEQSTAPRTRASRRRTKTGCLTCRKRRIKCGEERPICNNCIKSKRHCEGYNQRVVFKTPNTDFRASGSSNTIPFHTASMPGSARNVNQSTVPPSTQVYPHTPLAPRGPDGHEYGIAGDPVSATAGHNNVMGPFFPYGTPQADQLQQQIPLSDQYTPGSDTYTQSALPSQYYSTGHAPPTPVSASLQNPHAFGYNQYSVYQSSPSAQEQTPVTATSPTPETSFSMSSQRRPSNQRQTRPEWRTNIFDGHFNHQQQQQPQPQQQQQYQSSEYLQSFVQGHNYLSTPVTPSQGTGHFHNTFPYLCVGHTGNVDFPENPKFEEAIA